MHSIFTGILARTLGQASPHFSGIHPEDLYICGLLHDIGKIIMLENAPEQFEVGAAARARARSRPVSELEQEILGFTHADVGSVLAIKWFLPEDLTIAIRYHHAPERDPFHKALSGLICLSDAVASKLNKRLRYRAASGPRAIRGALRDRRSRPERYGRAARQTANEELAGTGMPWS
jgi:HD-like signal output (HDOD) protein